MHVFLTGEKRVGKTTLINRILSAFPGTVGGFRTVRLNTFLPGEYTVHLFPAHGSQEPAWENLLFVCGRKMEDTLSRFEALGCQALQKSTGADLLLMDELGPHEAQAAAFQQAVWAVLEGDTPVLGVLQKADSPFLKEIAAHPRVKLLEVTMENRDNLYERVISWLEKP